MRPCDIYPREMLPEMRRLAMLPTPWLRIDALEYPDYACVMLRHTWFERAASFGANDLCEMLAATEWLREGPKVVRVTEEQYQALAQVEVNLELKDVQLPYPTVCVQLPPGRLHKCCLVHRYSEDIAIFSCMSEDHLNNIVTMVRQRDGVMVETSLEQFDDSLADVAEESCQTLRMALNMLLCLVDAGYRTEHLFAKEVASDMRLAKEASERGERAKLRLHEQPLLVSFAQEVKLHDEERAAVASGCSGRELRFHWRRGHWRMQAHGAGHTLRKRLYVKPCKVREDKLTVPIVDTSVSYSV